jgi:hypothetical protein
MFRSRLRRVVRLGFSSMGEKNSLPLKAKQIGMTSGCPLASAVARWATRAARTNRKAEGERRNGDGIRQKALGNRNGHAPKPARTDFYSIRYLAVHASLDFELSNDVGHENVFDLQLLPQQSLLTHIANQVLQYVSVGLNAIGPPIRTKDFF